MLGHYERVNEQHYNYSMAENAEKKRTLEEVFSKVLKKFSKSSHKVLTKKNYYDSVAILYGGSFGFRTD